MVLGNEQKALIAAYIQAQQQGGVVDSVNHSRGSLTESISLQDLLNAGQSAPVGTVQFNGAAANAERMADVVKSVSSNSTAQVQQSTHSTDIVGTIIGGNAPTGGNPDVGFPTSHGTYGPNAPLYPIITTPSGELMFDTQHPYWLDSNGNPTHSISVPVLPKRFKNNAGGTNK